MLTNRIARTTKSNKRTVSLGQLHSSDTKIKKTAKNTSY